MTEGTVEDATDQAAVDAVVEAWVDGRKWIRCGLCGEVGDGDDPAAPSYEISVEDGEVVAVVCWPCAGLTT